MIERIEELFEKGVSILMFHINNRNQVKPCKADSPERCPFKNSGHFENESAATTVLENDLYLRLDPVSGLRKDRILELNETDEGEYISPRRDPKYFLKDMKNIVRTVKGDRSEHVIQAARVYTTMKSNLFNTQYTISRNVKKDHQEWIVSYRFHGRVREVRFPTYSDEKFLQKRTEFRDMVGEDFVSRYPGDKDVANKAADRDVITLFRAMDYIQEGVTPKRYAGSARKGYLYTGLVDRDDHNIRGQVKYEEWFDGDDVKRMLKMSSKTFGRFAKIDLRVYDESQKTTSTFWGIRHVQNGWYFERFEDGKITQNRIDSPDDAYRQVSEFIQKNHRRKGDRIEKAEWAKKFMTESDEAIREYNEDMANRIASAEEGKRQKKSHESLYGESKKNGFMDKMMSLFG